MPYNTTKDLPSNVKTNLPSAARTVWKNAFNSTLSSCTKDGGSRKNCELKAIKYAWTAVSNGWSKQPNGKWVRKKSK